MRISPRARRHARRLAAGRDLLDDVLEDGDELEGLFSTLGGIAGSLLAPGVGTALGSAIGGLLDGGSSTPAPASSGGAGVAAVPGGGGGAVGELPAAALAALRAAGASVPSLDDVRAVLRDALARDRAVFGAGALDAAQRARVARAAAQRVVAAIDPNARRVRGAVAVQRLQRQAADEHARAKDRADRDRVAATRHGELLAALERARRAFTLRSPT